MKKLLILLFSILISFNSYGEWTNVAESNSGNNYHLDLDNVKEYDGYIYYWEWNEYLKPTDNGTMGAIVYNQGDCNLGRTNALTVIFYDNPRLKGQGDPYTPPVNWVDETPGSVGKSILDYICNYIN